MLLHFIYIADPQQHLGCLLQGPNPAVHVFSTHNLRLLQTLKLGYELGYTALSFSEDGERLAIGGDEPDCSLSVYLWRKVVQHISPHVAMSICQGPNHHHADGMIGLLA